MIHRHEGYERPALSTAALRKLIEAHEDRVMKVEAGKATLGDLVRHWRPESPEWQALGVNTRKTWGSALDAIDQKWGQTPLAVWNDARMKGKVVAWRDSRADKKRAADMGVAVLRALLKFGQLRGRVAINVAEGIPQIYRNGSRAQIVWTDRDMDRFAVSAVELNQEHVLDVLRLAALTGLRREDLVTLKWDEVRTDAIVKLAAKVSRGKRREVIIPRLPALDLLLAELRNRYRKENVTTVLVNSFGASWSPDGLGGSFNRVRDHAEIFHVDRDTGEKRRKHLHDLRGTFCTKLVASGQLTNEEVAQIMGWSPEQVAGIRRTYVDQGAVNMAIAARLRGSL